ncbi:MAG: hypothetical protein QME32_01130 [Endomicrobiia bacterium]|nr:hypothetical protein [Endomicrobiia bacterium]
MKETLISISAIFVFLGLVVWQNVEVDRKRYILREYFARHDDLSAVNQRYFFRLKSIKSSEAMMRYASERKYRFASAADIIIVE